MNEQPIDPKLMELMQGGQQSKGNNPPAAAPMATPQPEEGKKQGASAQIHMAIAILEQTLSSFGSGSEEGEAVLKALTTLGHQFGSEREKGRELIPSEIMNLMSTLPQGAGAPPPQAQPKPGMAPGGMPGMQ
jgi:hypothetical protein